MKLTRKQRVYSLIIVIPLLPFAVALSLVNHSCYAISRVLERFSMKIDRIDRAIGKKFDDFIRSVK